MNEENKNVENLAENTEVLQPSEPVTETLIEVESLDAEPVTSAPEVIETETLSTEAETVGEVVIEAVSEPASETAPVEPVIINSEAPVETPTEATTEVATEAATVAPAPEPAPVEPAAPVTEAAPAEPTPAVPEEPKPVEPIPETKMIEPKKKGKGGLILIIIAVLALIGGGCYYFLVLNNNDNGNSGSSNNNNNNNNNGGETKNTKSYKDVTINGQMCINNDCTFTISGSELGEDTDFKFTDKRVDLFEALSEYSEYVKVDIDYTDGKEKTITNFTMYNKSTNEKVEAKTEEELRNALGLYNEGTYTEEYTLKEQMEPMMGFSDDEAYSSVELVFEDSNGKRISMNQKFESGQLIDTYDVDAKYMVTFEVKKGSFGYEYNITEISKIV